MPDNSERRQQELDLRITFGGALIATKGWGSPLAGETYTRARMLAEQLGRSEYQLPLIHGEWNYHTVQGRHRLALSLAEQIAQIAMRNDVAARLLGHRLGRKHPSLFRRVSRRQVTFRAVSWHRRPSHSRLCMRTLHQTTNTVWRYCNSPLTLMYLGYIDQARSLLSEGLSEARQLKHPYALTTALSFAGWAAMVGGSALEVKRYADERIALSNEHGLQLHLGYAMGADSH